VRWAALALAFGTACGGSEGTKVAHPQAGQAPLSLAADEHMVLIPEGKYIAGSTLEERGAAYDDYQTATTTDTAREQRWFETEADRHQTTLPAFRIDLMPVTQAQYAEIVAAGKAQPPSHPDPQHARFSWTGTTPPQDRLDHPVVLVTWEEASRYCAWRGELRGQPRRLPSAAEYEKAARGENGLAYPWGNLFEPAKLNSADGDPNDTLPAGEFAAGASPFGVLGLAGNARHWTSTAAGAGAYLVKGSGWDDHPGVGRAASGRATPATERAANVGFRCAGPP
jgi:formylglycine-generating enzyme required for sulfatase activity